MKKVLFSLFGVFMFISCSSDNEEKSTEVDNLKLSYQNFDYIGVDHNNILGSAVNALDNEFKNNNIDIDMGLKIVSDIIVDELDVIYKNDVKNDNRNVKYINNNYSSRSVLDNEDYNKNIHSIESGMNIALNYSKLSIKEENIKFYEAIGEDVKEIDIELINYLDKLDVILKVDEELSIMNLKMDELISEVENSKLSDKNKMIFYSTIAVAKHSVMFWKEYFKDNKNAYSVRKKDGLSIGTRGLWSYVKGCWQADAAGAVAGAVRGGIAGGLTPMGVVGFAAGGSAAYHVNQLF
ncbi:hypothetical protein [Myroides odoratimimus]|uniref:hypothetical protein n=1 Tax=Myroides odoratimimus TaxID=76832 RepID=UPI003100FB62